MLFHSVNASSNLLFGSLTGLPLLHPNVAIPLPTAGSATVLFFHQPLPPNFQWIFRTVNLDHNQEGMT